MFNRRGRVLIVSLGITGICLAALLRHMDVQKSFATLSQLSPSRMLLPLGIFLFIGMPLRALRWQWIFRRESRPTFRAALQAIGVGNAFNNLFPARAGDVARCAIVGRQFSGGSEALGTLVVEKIFDGLALLTVVLFSLWFLTPPKWVWRLGIISAVCFGSAWAFLVVLRYRGAWVLAQTGKIRRIGPRLASLLQSFSDGLSTLTSVRQTARIVLVTAGIWAADAALIWTLAMAMHVHLPFAASVVVSSILGLGQIIPAAPASLGTYELFGVAAFSLVGVDPSHALPVTLILHAWSFAAMTLFGFVCIAAAGLQFAQLRSVQRWPSAEAVPQGAGRAATH